MSCYIQSKIELTEEEKTKFGEVAIALANKWNELMDDLNKKENTKKERVTVQISSDVIERIKDAVYWTPGLTLSSLAEEAFAQVVDDLESERKAPFPKRKEELKTGRPIKDRK